MTRVLFRAEVRLAVLTGCGEVGGGDASPAQGGGDLRYKAAMERNLDIADCGVGLTHMSRARALTLRRRGRHREALNHGCL